MNYWEEDPEEEMSSEDRLAAIMRHNQEEFERELTRSSGIVKCKHYVNDRQVPCPDTCPRQSWPRYKFRVTMFGNWKLRRKYGRA